MVWTAEAGFVSFSGRLMLAPCLFLQLRPTLSPALQHSGPWPPLDRWYRRQTCSTIATTLMTRLPCQPLRDNPWCRLTIPIKPILGHLRILMGPLKGIRTMVNNSLITVSSNRHRMVIHKLPPLHPIPNSNNNTISSRLIHKPLNNINNHRSTNNSRPTPRPTQFKELSTNKGIHTSGRLLFVLYHTRNVLVAICKKKESVLFGPCRPEPSPGDTSGRHATFVVETGPWYACRCPLPRQSEFVPSCSLSAAVVFVWMMLPEQRYNPNG